MRARGEGHKTFDRSSINPTQQRHLTPAGRMAFKINFARLLAMLTTMMVVGLQQVVAQDVTEGEVLLV